MNAMNHERMSNVKGGHRYQIPVLRHRCYRLEITMDAAVSPTEGLSLYQTDFIIAPTFESLTPLLGTTIPAPGKIVLRRSHASRHPHCGRASHSTWTR